MIQTIRVYTTKGKDTKGEGVLSEIQAHHKADGIKKIKTAKVYRLEGITRQEAEKLATVLFSESINQAYTLNSDIFHDASKYIEIAYKPGVMNPEVGSILKCAHDLGIKPLAVDSNYLYAFYANGKKTDIHTLVSSIGLFNPLIETILQKEPKTLQITGKVGETQTIPLTEMSDEELLALSKNTLFLSLLEMQTIQNYFKKLKRNPTDCELETLAQTWSEHCVHKTFKASLIIDGKKKKPFFKRIKETANNNKNLIVSAFVDNSGVIDFYDGYAVCGKVETHNSPSAIEPYGGAMTGSGGVFRDVLGTGQGAKPVVSTDIFCFAPPNLPLSALPPGCLPPSYILTKVIQGVRDYGNRVGIPTNNGSLHFHKDFRAKPTVAVGSYGLIPKEFALKKTPSTGDLILTLGGRTGRDGIHGATFSSAEMTDETKTVSGPAVQIGNAIEEKRLIDAVLVLRDKKLIEAITDCGAGGYSSAIGEMAEKTGAKVYLERVPLKYEGLKPWEIFLSESQERMVIAISPTHLSRVLSICRTYNVEATMIGEFTNTEMLQVYYKDKLVCELTMEFLHNGLPQQTLVGKTHKKTTKEIPPQKQKDFPTLWKKVLSHPTVASKEPILRLYDHNVQGSNALHPFGGVHFDGPNDGSIVRPLLDKPYGLVTTHGLNPTLNQYDVYWGSIWAITEALSNYVSVGGEIKEAALIDNFIWPFPDEESLADLDKAVDACFDMAKRLKMPFVSGKDSLSSTYRYPDGKILKIPPVLLISVFGKIPDVTKTVSSDLKQVDSTLVLVGNMDLKSMGGSMYYEVTKGESARIPRVDIESLPRVFKAITDGIQKGYILSCHDISEGGLLTTLSEMCFGGDVGCAIDIANISKTHPERALLNETAGTFVVEVANESTAKKLFAKIPYTAIGMTKPEKQITIKRGSSVFASAKLDQLKKAWQRPMKEIFG